MTSEQSGRPGSSQQAAAEPSIVVYCRPWCPDCRRARDWLAQNGVEFIEVDVDVDTDARNRAQELNGGSLHTPTFELGEQSCVDFRPERLKEMLHMP